MREHLAFLFAGLLFIQQAFGGVIYIGRPDRANFIPPAAGGGSVTLDATADGGAFSARSSFTYSHTIASGVAAMLIFVGMSGDSRSVTGLTVGGNAATFLDSQTENTGANGAKLELWCISSPPSGSQTVSVTLNASTDVTAISYSLAGSGTCSSVSTPTKATGATTNISMSVSSATGALVIDGIINDFSQTCANSNTAMTEGAGQTAYGNICTDALVRLRSSYEVGAASVAMAWTQGLGFSYNQIAVSIVP